MTRITFNSINRHTQSVIQGRFSELAALQQKMATGKQISRPSEGAIETANILKLRTQNAQLKQYETNIYDGLAWMQITDTTMTSMNSIVHRARELAIQGNSDTMSPTERRFIVSEIEQLTLQMASLLNTRYKGDYIFSGSETNHPAIVLKESLTTESARRTNQMGYLWSTGADTLQIKHPNGSNVTDPSRGDYNVRRVIPGSLEIFIGGDAMREGIHYSVDYMTGVITILDEGDEFFPNQIPNPNFDNTLPIDADNPEYIDLPPHPMRGTNFFDPNRMPTPYLPGFDIRFNYLEEPADPHRGVINTDSRIIRQIEEGISIPINTTINDLAIDRNNDIFSSLIRLSDGLISGERDMVLRAIDNMDLTMNRILSAQATNGSVINRFDRTLERNEIQQTEVTRLQSNLEDADYATIVANYAVLQTVFNAALNSTARIMQTSLMDYIR